MPVQRRQIASQRMVPIMRLAPGDPAPWFVARSTNATKFHFDTVAGRYIVLCFFESAAITKSQRILEDIRRSHERFDDENVCFFGVSIDPDDERLARVRQQLPGIRFFWDFDRNISRLYGAVGPEGSEGQYRPFTIVLDAQLRTLAVFPFENDPETHVPRLLEFLGTLPSIATSRGHAPILVVPRVFEPEFCRTLVRLYEEHGGQESGFMRDEGGRTVGVVDYGHKRRLDYDISDQRIRKAAMVRIHDRLVPEIQKAFQFRATRLERYIVACYDAATGGHFNPHRDNTTKATAHRKFAVTINLNAGEYEGGDLRFPEYGLQPYRAATGGAIVFSCSLLHEATPVTRGRRFAFLPFLYDDEAAKIRKANSRFLGENVTPYQQ